MHVAGTTARVPVVFTADVCTPPRTWYLVHDMTKKKTISVLVLPPYVM